MAAISGAGITKEGISIEFDSKLPSSNIAYSPLISLIWLLSSKSKKFCSVIASNFNGTTKSFTFTPTVESISVRSYVSSTQPNRDRATSKVSTYVGIVFIFISMVLYIAFIDNQFTE